MEIERNQRKEAAEKKKKLQQFYNLLKALEQRQVKFDDQKQGQPITEELLKPKFLPLEDFPVHIDEDDANSLVWPAAFCYPEFLYSDFQQQLSEELT